MASSSSSSGFPSFRFSPDSEELEEIATSNSSADHNERYAESLPDSPKSVRFNTSSAADGSGGDTSPIKDYLKKKWDKRSMSLDLDLKGKIITAIEDKRKSMLSHFIPEETPGVVIPSSSKIAEHTGVAIGEPNNCPQNDNTSTNSETISTTSTNFDENESKQRSSLSLNQGNSKISFDNTSKQVHLSSSASDPGTGTGDNLSISSADENYEEVGLDYLENMTTAEQIDASILDVLFPFSLPPEQLRDSLLGSYVSPVLPTPSEEAGDASKQSAESGCPKDLEFGSIWRDMLMSLVLHEWTKYLFVLIGAGITGVFIEMPTFISAIYWFITGTLFSAIVSQSLFGEVRRSSEKHTHIGNGFSNILTDNIPLKMGIGSSFSRMFTMTGAFNQKHPRSQGWMTELDGEYDPYAYHVKLSKVVFVRMEGSFLYVSYPHSKHRISKRRLWSDPPLSSEITFSKHLVYNLLGAHVFIAPEKLARKRVWNKKYPLGIKLDKFSIVSTISPAPELPSGTKSTGTLPSLSHGTGPRPIGPLPTVHQESLRNLSPVETNKYQKGDKEVCREDCGGKILYLFPRTDREKDDWFRRLILAAKEERPFSLNKDKSEMANFVLQKLYVACMMSLIPKPMQDGKDTTSNEHNREAVSVTEKTPQNEKQPSPPPDRKSAKAKTQPVQQQDKKGNKNQQSVHDDTTSNSTASAGSSKRETPTDNLLEIEKILTIPHSPMFLNAFIGRIFFDFLRSSHWSGEVQKLIQKKLNYIRRPQFLDPLLVRELDLGHAFPVIQRASTPFIDSQGLWIDLDITYDGDLCVTLETKLNLMKLRKSPDADHPPAGNTTQPDSSTRSTGHTVTTDEQPENKTRPPNFLDSDADDSGESSEDDETDPDDFLAQQDLTSHDIQQASSDTSVGKPSKGAKFLRMAEKIANSAFVTEVKVVKKVIANVANIPLILSVELKSCKGTIALNIPPPPSDRVWIGFRTNPDMQVVAKPKVGARAVNLTHVTEWIRKKMLFEFQRVMVLPNMDDLTIPLMEFKLPSY